MSNSLCFRCWVLILLQEHLPFYEGFRLQKLCIAYLFPERLTMSWTAEQGSLHDSNRFFNLSTAETQIGFFD